MSDAETMRLHEEARREQPWKRWGPYLSERQWGTVREDYSADGSCWRYFPHDHARSRAYRWGEDGLLGICDVQGRLNFALALWNGRDRILKERLFGLTGPEGNHGEDVKELYYYLDSTPTHSYLKALYKYPQREYPYARLVAENRRRGKLEPELELLDTGVFDDGRYFDVAVEYAKAAPEDILVRIIVANRGPDAATLHLLPQLWFRNTWSWGRTRGEYATRPRMRRAGAAAVVAEHAALGRYRLAAEAGPDGRTPTPLFTDNDTNFHRLYGSPNPAPYRKDAFHAYVVDGDVASVNPAEEGTKAAFRYVLDVPAGGEAVVRLRLTAADEAGAEPFGPEFELVCRERLAEADAFYAARSPGATVEEARIIRQGYAGLLWSKQYYHYVVREWLAGDPGYPPPPPARRNGRNADWLHVHQADVILMPDKWEYPWFAAWDLAFHVVSIARIDPPFAKEQLLLLLREGYMHPNGQIPAYEFSFSDVNPPVHAWAVWRVYKMTGARGHRDRLFLERAFQKLLLNFTWWVNRKDPDGNHLFSGGFLGLDNIGIFDRSQALPGGGFLEQADGTAWMAFFCSTMLAIALELAAEDAAYEDVASKFFQHFLSIVEAINDVGGVGLWDERDGFFYDHLHMGDDEVALRLRSMVGLVPLLACEVLDQRILDRLPAFGERVRWLVENRPDLTDNLTLLARDGADAPERLLLAIPSRERLERVLRYLLDEDEFLSPHGIRSLSRVYRDAPYTLRIAETEYRVAYTPAESDSGLFGGNSNWRGPVWFPLNYLLVEALERYHHFFGDDFAVECPTGSGRRLTLDRVAQEITRRLVSIFLPDVRGRRPCHGAERRYAEDPHWKELLLFHEYFCGDTGRGVGASHQTGWTALVVRLAQDLARGRETRSAAAAETLTAPASSRMA